MITSALVVAALLAWLLLFVGACYGVGHGGTVDKTIRLEKKLARDESLCVFCGTRSPSEWTEEVIAVLPGGRELPVCDGCAADLSEEKIQQRLFWLASKLRDQVQYYLALSRCKVELADSEVPFSEMVQNIRQQIWPGT
jgi:hypothetical protein